MFNIIATFDNIISLKKLVKKLRKNPKVKGHILVINENDAIREDERYISSVLIKRSREISSLRLDDTLKGIIFGAIIGGISSVSAILFNVSLLGLSTIALLGILAIIFYGAAVGSIIGLLITNLISKYYTKSFDGEMTLIIKEVDDEVKNIVVDIIKEYTPEKFSIY
ncbi:hypothetical protein [Wukongibacter sp. M2B1]|uniref:hypothetical protein n=1 Tax=Wukongibacter sp. M2B1 TaxID=3088895 RepID=UPI003D7A9456|nr:hypothetical protein [Wukongibacter baidiensis]